jgi:SAM-dependent methyltransferase
MAEAFETQYVSDVYKKIAHEFDTTRNHVWSEVSDFIKLFDEHQCIADIGCGNGKNMIHPNMIGIDNCLEFVDICRKKNLNVMKGSILNIPLPDDTYDGVICIAVIHHLSTFERRQNAIKELIRIAKPNGQILITAWSEIGYKSSNRVETIDKNDKLVGWKETNQRYYHLFEKGEFEELVKELPVKVVSSGYEMKNWWICLEKV